MSRCARRVAILFTAVVLSGANRAAAVTIATTPIGNPGNLADATGYGAVAYPFQMGTTEITNAQYVEFLNAAAKADPRNLYTANAGIMRSGSSGNYTYAVRPPATNPFGGLYAYDNKPVANMTYYSAFRFANWLTNGQGNATTETGSYTLLGGTATPSNGTSVMRNPGARWVIPTEDEWYKAAYYDGSAGVYYDYATGDDATPDNHLPASDTGNSANYGGNIAFPFLLTDIGAYALSKSPYGTFDQSGNVTEVIESLYFPAPFEFRVIRGGNASDSALALSAEFRNFREGDSIHEQRGFRVALVPEPTSISLALVGVLAIGRLRCGRPRRHVRST